MKSALINRFEAGGPMLRRAIDGISSTHMEARPGPGEWSIKEVVIHLADSDAIAIDRMKRVIAEDDPAFFAANESAYIHALYSHEQCIEDALTLFEVGRRQFCRVLQRLPENAFDRSGRHDVDGEVTLAQLLETYTQHLLHHLQFIQQKLNAMSTDRQDGPHRAGSCKSTQNSDVSS